MEPQDVLDTIREKRMHWLCRIKQEDHAIQADRELLKRLLIPASYEGAAYWIARLQNHFPARQTDSDAVVQADVAGDCCDEGLSICALAKVCDELRNEATKQDPFMPPSGEIIKRTREQTKVWRELLERYDNPPQGYIEQRRQREPDPKANDDPDGPEKVRVIRQGLKMGKSPDQALQDAGYAVAGTGSGHGSLADLFERFWQAYPKQVAKPKAWEAFREAVAAGCDPETLIAAANIADEVASEQQIDRQYIPNPEKFLKERRWEDGEIKARLQGGAMEQATPHQEPVEA